jgi:EAL domain-containing protein (putative c-di-GMP-specific phosphodiesterase class I)
LSDIGQLHDVGVDYVKVDSAFVRGIHSNPANQTLLRTLCTLVHSLGIRAIAEGVDQAREWDVLAELGFDGATGPQVTATYGTGESQPDAVALA